MVKAIFILHLNTINFIKYLKIFETILYANKGRHGETVKKHSKTNLKKVGKKPTNF